MNPRHKVFEALKELDEEIGEVPHMGGRHVRMQATIAVINAMYPKPKERGLEVHIDKYGQQA